MHVAEPLIDTLTSTRHYGGCTIVEPPSLLQKAGSVMEPLRQEVHEFASASEKLLGYAVKLEELTVMEQRLIEYYVSAVGEKFTATIKAG